MPLTHTAVEKTKPTSKRQKLSDGQGMYLESTPKGGKRWRLKYRFDGKEKLLSLGTYPEVSLKDARDRRAEARKLLANDVDPSEFRKSKKAARADLVANSFEVLAREWFIKNQANWSESHGIRIIRRLERDIFPKPGKAPVSQITPPQVLKVIHRITERGKIETAHRALSNCGQVFRYAIATGRAETDPTATLRSVLPAAKAEHFAAVTSPSDVAQLLKQLYSYDGSEVDGAALKIAPLVFVRPGELRHAEWSHMDLKAREWRYTVTKMNTDHVVPLARQAIEVLSELQLVTGHGKYVFPSARNPRGDRPMSDNAICRQCEGWIYLRRR